MDHPLRVILPQGGYDILTPDADVLDTLASVRHLATSLIPVSLSSDSCRIQSPTLRTVVLFYSGSDLCAGYCKRSRIGSAALG